MLSGAGVNYKFADHEACLWHLHNVNALVANNCHNGDNAFLLHISFAYFDRPYVRQVPFLLIFTRQNL